MVLLEDVVHLRDVLARHRLDDEAVVVAGQEAVAEATLGVAVQRRAPRQRVLEHRGRHASEKNLRGGSSSPGFCYRRDPPIKKEI